VYKKANVRYTCYSAAFVIRLEEHFTISSVRADWHEVMILSIMRPSINESAAE